MQRNYLRCQKLILITSLIAACLAQSVKAQPLENDMQFIFAGPNSYVVDLNAQTAKQLPVKWADGYNYFFAGDGKYLAVVGKDGVTLYTFTNGSIEQTRKITDGPSSGGIWAKDSKTFTYIQETGSGTGTTVKIFIWSAVTDATKRIL